MIKRINPLPLSVYLHGSVVVFALLLNFIFTKKLNFRNVDFEVFENPSIVNRPLQIDRPKVIPKARERAIFGVTKDSIKSDEGLEVKAGNTVAKAQDNLQLRDDDAKSIPIPTDEYLVTAMPQVNSEFRIPYPEEAKVKKIEGPVVMNVLIDDQGVVRTVDVISGPGYGLNEAAAEAIKLFKFKPARVGEKPVAVKIRYTYRFVLER